MRIVIDARPVADHFPGIGRYVYNLLAAIAPLAPAHELIALTCPTMRNTRYDLASIGIPLFATDAQPFSAAEHLRIPALLRTLHADLYHATYYVRPYFGLPCPSVTTLYDIIPRRFPQASSPRARILFDLLHRLAIRSSRRLLAISNSARDDLIAAYHIPAEQIVVTPLAADPQFHQQPPTLIAALRSRYQLPQRYVLTLASNKPHKNILGLLRAWNHVVHNATTAALPLLVIAGHWDSKYREAPDLADQLGLAGTLRFLPDPPAADLPALYGGAELFIYPSLYEGFGLPPLEAMACGVPVLCGNTSSLPEVVGDAAQTVDVADPLALAHAIQRTLSDAPFRARLRESGLVQASRFNWHRTAQLTLDAYG
jgi:alpha-1,3-rhamnosyl/mannosyltransferase